MSKWKRSQSVKRKNGKWERVESGGDVIGDPRSKSVAGGFKRGEKEVRNLRGVKDSENGKETKQIPGLRGLNNPKGSKDLRQGLTNSKDPKDQRLRPRDSRELKEIKELKELKKLKNSNNKFFKSKF